MAELLPSEPPGNLPPGEASHEVFLSEVSTSRDDGLLRYVGGHSYRPADRTFIHGSTVDDWQFNLPFNLRDSTRRHASWIDNSECG